MPGKPKIARGLRKLVERKIEEYKGWPSENLVPALLDDVQHYLIEKLSLPKETEYKVKKHESHSLKLHHSFWRLGVGFGITIGDLKKIERTFLSDCQIVRKKMTKAEIKRADELCELIRKDLRALKKKPEGRLIFVPRDFISEASIIHDTVLEEILGRRRALTYLRARFYAEQAYVKKIP